MAGLGHSFAYILTCSHDIGLYCLSLPSFAKLSDNYLGEKEERVLRCFSDGAGVWARIFPFPLSPKT